MGPTSKAATGPTRQGVREFMHKLAQKQRTHRGARASATTSPASQTSSTRPRTGVVGEMNADTLKALSDCRGRAAALLLQPAQPTVHATMTSATTKAAEGTASVEATVATSATTRDTPVEVTATSASTSASTTAPTNTTAATATGRAASGTTPLEGQTVGCFSQVLPEAALHSAGGDTDNALCGLTAAVSAVLRVREFAPSDSTVLRQLIGQKEVPLVAWMRRHGAVIVGELAPSTPFSINDGACFGPRERSAEAIVGGACHFAFTASLLGPPALSSCAGQDVVGFKPTAQTFGTFTDDFKMPIAAMTVGVTAGTVDDLLYLWQSYTASISTGVVEAVRGDSVSLASGAAHEESPSRSQTTYTDASEAMTEMPLEQRSHDANTGPDPRTSAATHVYADPGILDHSPANYTIQPDSREVFSLKPEKHTARTPAPAAPAAPRHVSFHLQHHAQVTPAQSPTTAGSDTQRSALRPQGHTRWSPQPVQGGLADIDIGWRDYNATAMRESYRRLPSSPGWWRHLFRRATRRPAEDAEDGAVKEDAGWLSSGVWPFSHAARREADKTSHGGAAGTRAAASSSGRSSGTPLVELTVGYPSDWLDGLCAGRYGGAEAFRTQLARMVYTRSTLHKDRKMEIVPLAIDLDLLEVREAVRTIAAYETALAFNRLLPARLMDMQSHHGATSGAAPAPAVASESLLGHVASAAATDDSTPSRAGGVTAATPTSTPSSVATPSPTLALLTSVLQELPPDVLGLLDEGQRVSQYAYHRALRTRDEVVRVTEDHFQDVDMLVVPMLCAPYASGDLNSLLPVLPFHLAGNPMVSMQLTAEMPVVLVEQPGRDAALLEDAYRFAQFARGSSPRWW